MADVLSFDTEKCLVWDISNPPITPGGDLSSPDFHFQNVVCYFYLQFNYNNFQGKYEYSLYIRSKSGKNLLQSFSFTSYIKCQDCLLSCLANSVRDTSSVLRTFPTYYSNENINLRTIGKFQIVMIFHDEVGSTLHIQSGSGATSDVSNSKKSIPDIESLTCELSRLQLLSQDISKLLDGDLYQDVEVKCGDETFKAHRAVLCTRSEVFLAMLQSDMLEGQTARVEVKDMKSNVCKDLLHYMYSGKLPELSLEKARGLFEAADRYNVGGLMQPCAEFLIKNLTSDNACDMLVLADAHSDKNFKDSVVEYLLEKQIPRKDDIWGNFCNNQPILAIEVLNKFYKLHVTS